MSVNWSEALFATTVYSVSVYGAFFSTALLYVLWCMNIYNDFTKLVMGMTICQLIVDIFFSVSEMAVSMSSMIIFNGICVLNTLISCMISYSVYHLLFSMRSFDLMKNIWYILGFMLFLSFFWIPFVYVGMSEKSSTSIAIGLWIPDITRLVSILYNFIVWRLCSHRANQTKSMSSSSASVHEKAIFRVVDRMKWYPMLQSASRAPVLLYHAVYGFEFNPVYSANRASYIWGIVVIWCFLIAPIGFFFVYLMFYPKAKELIYQKLGLHHLIDKKRLSTGTRLNSPARINGLSVGKGSPKRPNNASATLNSSEEHVNDDDDDDDGDREEGCSVGVSDQRLSNNKTNTWRGSRKSSNIGPLSVTSIEAMEALPDDPNDGIGDSDAELLFLINSSHHARGLIDASGGGSGNDLPMTSTRPLSAPSSSAPSSSSTTRPSSSSSTRPSSSSSPRPSSAASSSKRPSSATVKSPLQDINEDEHT